MPGICLQDKIQKRNKISYMLWKTSTIGNMHWKFRFICVYAMMKLCKIVKRFWQTLSLYHSKSEPSHYNLKKKTQKNNELTFALRQSLFMVITFSSANLLQFNTAAWTQTVKLSYIKSDFYVNKLYIMHDRTQFCIFQSGAWPGSLNHDRDLGQCQHLNMESPLGTGILKHPLEATPISQLPYSL